MHRLGLTAVVGQFFQLNVFITNMVVAMGLARARRAQIQEAIMAVAGSATRAVVFSGTSFVLAMSAMLLVPDTTLRSLGLGAVIVGLVSIAVALTFHPAPRGGRPDPVRQAARRKRVLAARRVRRDQAPGAQPGFRCRDPARAGDLGPRPADGLGGRGWAASVDFLEYSARNSTVDGRDRPAARRLRPARVRPEATVLVGGSPAEARDAFAVNAGWLPIVIGVVLTLSFALLTLAFRSIAIPLTAIAVNLLSGGAAYGLLVLVFQKGLLARTGDTRARSSTASPPPPA